MTIPPPRYATYTWDHPNILVRFPHRKRNKLVANKIADVGASSWLDYGAGDGTLLGELLNRKVIPETCVLYEPDPYMHSQLVENISELALIGRVKPICDLSYLEYPLVTSKTGGFGLVTALEVLEHLPLPERIKFYQFIAANLKSDGIVLIELPIEYGPVLLLKEWGRRVLKKRISEYSARELVNAAFCGTVLDAHSRYLPSDERTFISPHRGFDLSRLIMELTTIGSVKEVVRSPLPFLPRIFNQVVLFSFTLQVRDPSNILEAVMRSAQSVK